MVVQLCFLRVCILEWSADTHRIRSLKYVLIVCEVCHIAMHLSTHAMVLKGVVSGVG